jgi:hypothetical protein
MWDFLHDTHVDVCTWCLHKTAFCDSRHNFCVCAYEKPGSLCLLVTELREIEGVPYECMYWYFGQHFFCVQSNKMVKHNSTLVPHMFQKMHKVESNAMTRMTGIYTMPIQVFTSSLRSVFDCLNLEDREGWQNCVTLFALKNTGGGIVRECSQVSSHSIYLVTCWHSMRDTGW